MLSFVIFVNKLYVIRSGNKYYYFYFFFRGGGMEGQEVRILNYQMGQMFAFPLFLVGKINIFKQVYDYFNMNQKTKILCISFLFIHFYSVRFFIFEYFFQIPTGTFTFNIKTFTFTFNIIILKLNITKNILMCTY